MLEIFCWILGVTFVIFILSSFTMEEFKSKKKTKKKKD